MTPVAQSFDPYEEWLEIPAVEQPADHYRLLGLKRGEADAGRIGAAADERMSRVRERQLGPQAEISQRILNELAAARQVLLDPKRRAAYDTVLRTAAPAVAQHPDHWPPGAAPIRGELTAGDIVGQYRILERSSASTLGVTYKVQHRQTKRYFFLKTLPPKAAKKQEVRKRFQREVEILTRLNHPNLIVACDSGEHAGLPYLVLDYVLGADLSRLVREQGPLPIEQAIDYAVQTARGLGELHWHGVFHRNIKPHALLVDLRGNLRITNLLLAKIGEGSTIDDGSEDLTVQGESMGSIDYLPPEQAMDSRKADERSDIYALGCTLFYLLTGRPPFDLKKPIDKLIAHQKQPPPRLRQYRPDAPAWLDDCCRKMLAKAPADRHQRVNDVVADLTNPPSARPWWRRALAWMRLTKR